MIQLCRKRIGCVQRGCIWQICLPCLVLVKYSEHWSLDNLVTCLYIFHFTSEKYKNDLCLYFLVLFSVGRKCVFFLNILVTVLGRFMLLFASSNYLLYSIAGFIGGLSMSLLFQSPYIISIEIMKSWVKVTYHYS